MKILVTGGTGIVGAEVVKELQKRRADIRLLVRKEGAPTPKGVEVAIGDLLDPVSVQKALHRVDKLYLLNAVVPDELTQGLIAYDLAKRLKLKHVVYHSVFRVDHFKDVPHFASKLAIENALREFDVPFTIIRPNYFSQNDATLKDALTKAGIYPAPLGQVGISVVDVRDIAEATAIALTSDGHFGKTYNLNGPDVVSGPRMASIWSGLLGAGRFRALRDDDLRRRVDRASSQRTDRPQVALHSRGLHHHRRALLSGRLGDSKNGCQRRDDWRRAGSHCPPDCASPLSPWKCAPGARSENTN